MPWSDALCPMQPCRPHLPHEGLERERDSFIRQRYPHIIHTNYIFIHLSFKATLSIATTSVSLRSGGTIIKNTFMNESRVQNMSTRVTLPLSVRFESGSNVNHSTGSWKRSLTTCQSSFHSRSQGMVLEVRRSHEYHIVILHIVILHIVILHIPIL